MVETEKNRKINTTKQNNYDLRRDWTIATFESFAMSYLAVILFMWTFSTKWTDSSIFQRQSKTENEAKGNNKFILMLL